MWTLVFSLTRGAVSWDNGDVFYFLCRGNFSRGKGDFFVWKNIKKIIVRVPSAAGYYYWFGRRRRRRCFVGRINRFYRYYYYCCAYIRYLQPWSGQKLIKKKKKNYTWTNPIKETYRDGPRFSHIRCWIVLNCQRFFFFFSGHLFNLCQKRDCFPRDNCELNNNR